MGSFRACLRPRAVHVHDIREALKQHWYSVSWMEFFDLFEYCVDLLAKGNPQIYATMNAALESQGCAYRFIGNKLAPLTNKAEHAEVERAAESAIPAVAAHIHEAVKLLPPSVDASPRNSIKESISAVEAALKQLSGDPSATFSKGLAAFEAKHGAMHGALRAGLNSLYGYTSDEKGVRHALVDEVANVSIDDARFMLVACSAFANYLVALSSAPKGA